MLKPLLIKGFLFGLTPLPTWEAPFLTRVGHYLVSRVTDRDCTEQRSLNGLRGPSVIHCWWLASNLLSD